MADGARIKARIASVTETKKVTDAMYMIASVKMRRARKEVEQTEPYFNALTGEIGKLIAHIPETENRYFKIADPEAGTHWKHGILVVTSDKGLAGSYNEMVLSLCDTVRQKHPETVLFVLGEYGRQHFRRNHVPYVEDFRYSAEMPTIWKARRICADLLEYFKEGRLDEINIIYTDYQNGRPTECKRNILLPLKRSAFALPEVDHDDEEDPSEFYPDPETVLNGIIPSYLTGIIYSILVDSYCSEQQARMAAMSSASSNAEEMLSNLRLQYNSVRQAAITREMTEITAGAKALRKKKEAEKAKRAGSQS